MCECEVYRVQHVQRSWGVRKQWVGGTGNWRTPRTWLCRAAQAQQGHGCWSWWQSWSWKARQVCDQTCCFKDPSPERCMGDTGWWPVLSGKNGSGADGAKLLLPSHVLILQLRVFHGLGSRQTGTCFPCLLFDFHKCKLKYLSAL